MLMMMEMMETYDDGDNQTSHMDTTVNPLMISLVNELSGLVLCCVSNLIDKAFS